MAVAALLMLTVGPPEASAQGTTLTITKDDSVDPVAPGATLTYTVRVQNTGAQTATNVVVNETYDGKFTFVSASPSPTAGNNSWTIPGLAPGGEATFAITGTVSATNGQTLTNTATAQAQGTPGFVARRVSAPLVTAVETTAVSSAAPGPPTLEISKTGSSNPVVPGAPLTYTIRVRNTGGTTATGVVVTETFPGSFIVGTSNPVPSSGNNVWNLPDISPGLEATVAINGTVNPAAVDGNVLMNAVMATSTNATTVNTTLNTTVDTSVAPATTLSVTKTDTVDPATRLGPLGYTVTVQNTGATTAFNVVLTETYPSEFVFTSASPPPTTGNSVWNLGNIAAGAQTSVNISGTVSAAATNGQVLTNNVAAVATNATASGTEDTTITAPTGAVLEITKADSVDPLALTGGVDTLTYTITVRNTGVSTAPGVTLTDTYDSKFGFTVATPHAYHRERHFQPRLHVEPRRHRGRRRSDGDGYRTH